MGWLTAFAAGFLLNWLGMMKVIGGVLAVEAIWSRETMLLGRRLRAILFQTVYTAARVLFFLAFYSVMRDPLAAVTLPAWAAVPVAILVYDFCYYWMHRAQHAVPFLWRFHKVHHSIEHMGAGSGYHHIIDIPIELVCLTFPLALFADPKAAALATTLIAIHGTYLHSTSRLHLGRLAWLVGDNRTHLIHHSRDPRHFDKNFGVPLLLWDRVFGTARLPSEHEWPTIGIGGYPEPTTVRGFLLGPPSLAGENVDRSAREIPSA